VVFGRYVERFVYTNKECLSQRIDGMPGVHQDLTLENGLWTP